MEALTQDDAKHKLLIHVKSGKNSNSIYSAVLLGGYMLNDKRFKKLTNNNSFFYSIFCAQQYDVEFNHSVESVSTKDFQRVHHSLCYFIIILFLPGSTGWDRIRHKQAIKFD